MANTEATTSTPTTHTYRISCEGVGGLPAPDKDVEAAYFQQDGQFTVFKDAANAAVFSVQNRALISIERLAHVALTGDAQSTDQTA